jgi:hypothetical protein
VVGGYAVNYVDGLPLGEFEMEWIGTKFSRPQYGDVLTGVAIESSLGQLAGRDVSDPDAEHVLALNTSAFRHDHCNEGVPMEYFRSGAIMQWLKRLKLFGDGFEDKRGR